MDVNTALQKVFETYIIHGKRVRTSKTTKL